MTLLIIIIVQVGCTLYVFNMATERSHPDPFNMVGERRHHDDRTSVYAEDFENNFFDSFLHTYLISFGEFDFEGYGNRGKYQNYFLWVLFFFATFTIQLVFMNMLIAIMSESYDRVKQKW